MGAEQPAGAAPEAVSSTTVLGVQNAQSTPSATPLEAIMDSCISAGTFRLEKLEVEKLAREHSLPVEQVLRSLVGPASRLARAPISHFYVGAVGLAGSGKVYIGVNLEFPGLPLSNSVHAEQFLVLNALQGGEQELTRVAVSEVPCGHCRQFMAELACADSLRFLLGANVKSEYTLADLLPMRFKPQDVLGEEPGPLLMQPQQHAMAFTPASTCEVQRRDGDRAFVQATHAAVEAASKSYVPYTRCPAGVGIVTRAGGVYSGGSAESAAYNPTLPPLQAAFVNAVVGGMGSYSQVTEVVLVELEDAGVKHRDTTRVMLNGVAPEATFTVLFATLSPEAAPHTSGA